jgi:4a-hydroxytetrahydrobiopterin dehydratase
MSDPGSRCARQLARQAGAVALSARRNPVAELEEPVMPLLTEDQIRQRLDALAGWTREGRELRRTFTFATFALAMAFVNRVAELAEAADHHPDIDIRYNRVTLGLSTHSAGGLTSRDMDLAARIDALNAGAGGGK